MAKEIERKFLVDLEMIKPVLEASSKRYHLRQYYIVASKELAIRLRVENNQRVVLAIKSGTNPMEMNEIEFVLPWDEYEHRRKEMVGIEISKLRHYVEFDGRTWEIDVFSGDLDGLTVAEIECDDAAEISNFPEWVTKEVTFDTRFKNARLALEGLNEIDLSKEGYNV
ncbi:CYTH domain-containing protein [Rhizobium sp. MHM7A]|uniref:CYTH domain-containing protein n=1 Tax=Rhizobium sp. MHM7A TaxID=2583233 RepID=UPI001106E4E5|nr:CYTH domain-containing protein [Rhizobium sp. MHM7A]TLX16732.1 CYTH domain-containing protein [Rhizobium sp. MHM7A]